MKQNCPKVELLTSYRLWTQCSDYYFHASLEKQKTNKNAKRLHDDNRQSPPMTLFRPTTTS